MQESILFFLQNHESPAAHKGRPILPPRTFLIAFIKINSWDSVTTMEENTIGRGWRKRAENGKEFKGERETETQRSRTADVWMCEYLNCTMQWLKLLKVTLTSVVIRCLPWLMESRVLSFCVFLLGMHLVTGPILIVLKVGYWSRSTVSAVWRIYWEVFFCQDPRDTWRRRPSNLLCLGSLDSIRPRSTLLKLQPLMYPTVGSHISIGLDLKWGRIWKPFADW